MAPAQEEVLFSTVTYEELADLEKDFDDVETEIIRQQVQLTKPLYEKRAKTVAQIPNFWPLVLEQAPPDIDEYIQPSDSAVLLSSLTTLSVSHFELDTPGGDPRSVSFRFEFAPNDYFEDAVLEKKFWFRHAEDGSAGLVSEPVDIRWKKGKDLTQGLLGLVKKVWDEEQAALAKNGASNGAAKKSKSKKEKKAELTAEQKALKKKIENIGLGALSFFAWFGYRGQNVTAEESKAAVEKEQKARQLRREGKPVQEEKEEDGEDEEDEEEEDDEDDEDSLEIFPEGEQLAVCIAEDLWPGAIKYFTQAQEQDAMSDEDFESDAGEDDEAPELVEVDGDQPPAKKRKA